MRFYSINPKHGMTNTVGIIGMGWVGSSVAISTLHRGVAQTLLLNDIREEVAEGEAMDLAHGAAFYPAATVQTVAVEDMCEADVVIVTAGRGGKPNESRLDLLQSNAAIIRDIGRRLTGCKGIIVVLSNPVDVLTHVMMDASGLPPERVIGTGTMLETARMRHAVGRELDLAPRSVHVQVLGEHGDSSVPVWSGARIGGVPLREWNGWTPGQEEALTREVRRAAYEIIRRKGATNHAIGLVTASLTEWILTDARRVLTVSRVQQGALGVDDVSLSLPAVVGRDGAADVLEPTLDEAEHEGLARSAEILREATESVLSTA